MLRKVGIAMVEIFLCAQIIMLVMKLCGVGIPILWVFAPLWIPGLLMAVLVSIYVIRETVIEVIERRKRQRWH